MKSEISRWQCKNVVVWVDNTLRPWRTRRTYYNHPPVISFDGQVYWLKEAETLVNSKGKS